MQELLDNDLEHCIDEAFNKLDIRDDHKVMIRVIKAALFSSMKLQKKTQMKQYNKEMQRHLNDSFNLKSYSKNAFKGFLLKVLRPEKLLREQSELEKISNKYINR